MRYSLLAAALAVAMGSTSFSASAADNRDQTIAELKAQLEALTAKVAELEERSDAQSDVNIDTAAQLDKQGDHRQAWPAMEKALVERALRQVSISP